MQNQLLLYTQMKAALITKNLFWFGDNLIVVVCQVEWETTSKLYS